MNPARQGRGGRRQVEPAAAGCLNPGMSDAQGEKSCLPLPPGALEVTRYD